MFLEQNATMRRTLSALALAAGILSGCENGSNYDFTLESGGFTRLEIGMSRSDAECVVGHPDFVRHKKDIVEGIYVLAGEEYQTYKFVRLSYDAGGRLISGVYDTPVKKL